MKGLVVGLVVGALGGGFVAGRLSAPGPLVAGSSLTLRPLPVQAQLPNDPREVIPLVPGPGDEPGQGQPRPGQGPQQPGQGQGQGQEQCVLVFKDGQMYRMPASPGRDRASPDSRSPAVTDEATGRAATTNSSPWNPSTRPPHSRASPPCPT